MDTVGRRMPIFHLRYLRPQRVTGLSQDLPSKQGAEHEFKLWFPDSKSSVFWIRAEKRSKQTEGSSPHCRCDKSTQAGIHLGESDALSIHPFL